MQTEMRTSMQREAVAHLTAMDMTMNGEKCPICSGARVIAGINDLAALETLLVKQWSKKNKIIITDSWFSFLFGACDLKST